MEIFWTNQCQPFVMVSMTQVQGAQSTAATDLSIIKGKCIQVLLTFLECQMSQTLLPNSNRSSFAIPKELLSDASNICFFLGEATDKHFFQLGACLNEKVGNFQNLDVA